MKKTGKIFSVVLAIMLVFAMSIPAFAADTAGTGTIIITNAISGETYSAYQMLTFTPVDGAANAGIYKAAEGWADFFTGVGATYFDVDSSDETISLKNDADLAALATDALTYAKNKTATASQRANNSQVVLSNLPLGYYIVDTSLGTICALTNTNSEETAIEKNAGPALEKKIIENSAFVDANTAAIGDEVTYQATITIGEGVHDYIMHDKMSAGLKDAEVVSVKINDTDVSADEYTVEYVDNTDDCTFEIAFDNDYTASLKRGTEIIVTYKATVDTDAVIGATGNPNEAWLAYNTGDTVKATPEDIVITYTTKLTVNKTDGTNPLEGAGFTLFKQNGDSWNPVGEVQTGATTFEWIGLDEGTYKIEETIVPNGYNKAKDIEFTISADVPETVKTVTDTATWKESNDVNAADGTYKTTIVNSTGGLLPETGGIGTTIIYIVGAILVVGAVVILISKKKTSAEA